MFIWTAGLSKEESATVECPVSSLCLLSTLSGFPLFSYCSMALLSMRSINSMHGMTTACVGA
jgi:hypothetical protein